MRNVDPRTVSGFGQEWAALDQSSLSHANRLSIFNDYFGIFPWENLPSEAIGADIGCGSGRWALMVAPRVRTLHCIDASSRALEIARRNLSSVDNVQFHHASADNLPIPDGYLDFAYSLGVLHHVPDTASAIKAIAQKLKPRGLFLLYLYYAFDNRPFWYRSLWRYSNFGRTIISQLPFPMRFLVSQLIAAVVYWPFARLASLLEWCGFAPEHWPLAYYRNKDFYVMRTDALDRFGTTLERRFTLLDIKKILETSGFSNVRFSNAPPYWCAIAERE